MAGISIHVYDVSRGVPAAGLRVELRGPDGKLLIDSFTAQPGTLEGPTPVTGTYEAVFHVGDWYRAQGVALPSPAFLETVLTASASQTWRSTIICRSR